MAIANRQYAAMWVSPIISYSEPFQDAGTICNIHDINENNCAIDNNIVTDSVCMFQSHNQSFPSHTTIEQSNEMNIITLLFYIF